MSVMRQQETPTTIHLLHRPHEQEELMMHKTSRTSVFAAGLSLLLSALSVAAQDLPADLHRGKALYQDHCATCHGQTGWGDGPTAASLRVAPANFHRFRSFLKSDEELLRTIEHGIVFSPMHAWTGSLTEGQMVDVLAYVRLLSQQSK
jgi:mono/diheme cytochrome c family protein